MTWPRSLEYPVEEIELVATFIITDEGHIPTALRDWASRALTDVAEAAAQTDLFND